MEQIKSFEEFYEIKLKPYLLDLQIQNRQAGHWGIALVVSFLLLIPGIILGTTILGGWTIATVIILLIVCVYNYTKVNDRYEDNFKEQVIHQIIDFIKPGLVYKPGKCIHSTYYKNSSLLRSYYTNYDGNDLLEGSYKDVDFQCSELMVSGNARNSNIFKGLFFAATVNSGITGGTYIWAKGAEQLPASIADERYRLMPMPDIIEVDFRNDGFENHYSVYSTDLYEASAIVTAEMMQCIMDLKRQVGRSLVLSFVAGMCYVAIPFNGGLLEPNSGNPDNKEAIKQYFFTVLLILSIINKLQLKRLQ